MQSDNGNDTVRVAEKYLHDGNCQPDCITVLSNNDDNINDNNNNDNNNSDDNNNDNYNDDNNNNDKNNNDNNNNDNNNKIVTIMIITMMKQAELACRSQATWRGCGWGSSSPEGRQAASSEASTTTSLSSSRCPTLDTVESTVPC